MSTRTLNYHELCLFQDWAEYWKGVSSNRITWILAVGWQDCPDEIVDEAHSLREEWEHWRTTELEVDA